MRNYLWNKILSLHPIIYILLLPYIIEIIFIVCVLLMVLVGCFITWQIFTINTDVSWLFIRGLIVFNLFASLFLSDFLSSDDE